VEERVAASNRAKALGKQNSPEQATHARGA